MSISIRAHDYRELQSQGTSLLIDVRTVGEFATEHAEGAINIPLDGLTEDEIRTRCAGTLPERIFFLCHSGKRAERACESLSGIEGTQLVVIEGGTEDWKRAGLPLVRGSSKVISLERQVRIVAGLFVAIGSILALVSAPVFAALPLFVGCGLVFSGVTDTCGMALLLGKMPWNTKGSSCCTSGGCQ